MKSSAISRPKIASDSIDSKYKLKSLVLIGSLLVTFILITNIVGIKITTIFGYSFSVGTVLYAFVYLCTDIIGEIWGKRVAYHFVFLGFLANILLVLFTFLAVQAPPADFWAAKQEAFAETFGSMWKIVFASMIAYLVSQLHDVWAFDYWRRQTDGKYLWLRNCLSTISSQTIDTFIFITIAFGLSMNTTQLIDMIVGQITIKWTIAVLDTPMLYLIRWRVGGPVEGAHD